MKKKLSDQSYTICSQDLTLFYGTKKILSIPDFIIEPHSRLLLQGPSGSGKSSFIRLIAGLILPTGGSLVYKNPGQSITTRSADFINFRRENINITFSEPVFFQDLSVHENILFPHLFTQFPFDPLWKNHLIDTLDVRHLLLLPIYTLSSGEQDRINLLRALLYDRGVLLLDEPGAHLDRSLFAAFHGLLGQYLERVHPTLVLISHSDKFLDLIEKKYICEKGVLTLG